MHPAELNPLHLPEPGGLTATIAGVPIETFLAPSGTGGGRRRAGLRGVAEGVLIVGWSPIGVSRCRDTAGGPAHQCLRS